MRSAILSAVLFGLVTAGLARIAGTELTVRVTDISPKNRHTMHPLPLAFKVSVNGGDSCSPRELQCCPLGSENEEDCKCVEGEDVLRTRRYRKNVHQGGILLVGDEWDCPPPENPNAPPLLLCCELGATDPQNQCDCIAPMNPPAGDL